MKIVVKEIDWEEMDWIHLAENRDRWQTALGSM
jgi:hypothetical protein